MRCMIAMAKQNAISRAAEFEQVQSFVWTSFNTEFLYGGWSQNFLEATWRSSLDFSSNGGGEHLTSYLNLLANNLIRIPL